VLFLVDEDLVGYFDMPQETLVDKYIDFLRESQIK